MKKGNSLDTPSQTYAGSMDQEDIGERNVAYDWVNEDGSRRLAFRVRNSKLSRAIVRVCRVGSDNLRVDVNDIQ